MKQVNSGKFIGAILDTLNRMAFFISIGNTGLIIITFYNTDGVSLLKRVVPWLNFWWFLLIIGMAVLGLMAFVYFVITPSYFNFYSNQFYKHDSPMKRDIELIKKKLNIND
jgi:hypothetical protein